MSWCGTPCAPCPALSYLRTTIETGSLYRRTAADVMNPLYVQGTFGGGVYPTSSPPAPRLRLDCVNPYVRVRLYGQLPNTNPALPTAASASLSLSLNGAQMYLSSGALVYGLDSAGIWRLALDPAYDVSGGTWSWHTTAAPLVLATDAWLLQFQLTSVTWASGDDPTQRFVAFDSGFGLENLFTVLAGAAGP